MLKALSQGVRRTDGSSLLKAGRLPLQQENQGSQEREEGLECEAVQPCFSIASGKPL